MKTWKLILSLVICLGTGYLSGLIGDLGDPNWYSNLQKPAWTPPPLTFPIVWFCIYVLMGIALWLVWIKKAKPSAYWAFAIQLTLNFLWMPLVFGLGSLFAGVLIAALLWVAIWATLILFGRYAKLAALCLLPYLIWATFAFALALKIYQLN